MQRFNVVSPFGPKNFSFDVYFILFHANANFVVSFTRFTFKIQKPNMILSTFGFKCSQRPIFIATPFRGDCHTITLLIIIIMTTLCVAGYNFNRHHRAQYVVAIKCSRASFNIEKE